MSDGNIEKLPKDQEEEKSTDQKANDVEINESLEKEKAEAVKEIKEEVEQPKEEVKTEEEVVPVKDDEKPQDIEKEKPAEEEGSEKEETVKNSDTKDNSEDAATKKVEPKQEIPKIDFSKLSMEEIVTKFENLLYKFPVQDYKNQFQDIKTSFLNQYKPIVKEAKSKFLEEGGNEIDFSFSSSAKNSFDKLVRDFKKKRQQYYKQIEKEQNDNLEKRLELIDRLKHLIDNGEPSTMYNEFRTLQNEWRETGQIPRSQYNHIWRTYHFNVERFYDLLHLNKELRDLDFKHNLEVKTKLVEKAEELAASDDMDTAFRELQVLHRMWKEEVGPVAREIREDIWNRFSEATKTIHHKRHELQKEFEAKFEENYEKKKALIEKIKAFDIESVSSHNAWQEAIKKIEELREEFFKIGKVARTKNQEIWKSFKDATRDFNKSKNAFYKNIKKDQNENLNKKMQLVDQAESLKDSDDWDTVTDIFKKIQSDWKKIGHVPKKDSDKIWKKFKDACNHFFDRLHERQDGNDKEQVEAFNKKKELLSQFKDFMNDDKNFNLDAVNTYVEDWRNLGSLPVKMRHIESKFNKALDAAYKKLNIDENEAAFLKFKNIIDSYAEQKDEYKLNSEQQFVRKKIDELTREVKQLENNLSFISNATDDNPLVQNVLKNIDNKNKDLDVWKRKIDYLKILEY
ncbi:MAG: DUF349 domain-containing protein [Bacteroidota bacterium]